MSVADAERRLSWHGVLLVLLGFLMGAVVQSVANPRMGLSAHVGTVMNGILVLALGAVWGKVALRWWVAASTFWLVVLGSYANCAALFAAGVFGTSRSTPLHGAGYRGTPWQEWIVNLGLTAGALALLVACALVLWGLGRPRAAHPR